MRQIVLDTETTGLRVEEGHRIIEIGCVELINRKLTGNHFHYYLNPHRDIDAGAQAVHGITNEFLQDKPTFTAIAHDFLQFVSGAELIIHNAPFDLAFLNHELRLTQLGFNAMDQYCTVLDTLLLARKLHIGQRNSLDALCKRYAIDNSKRDMHGALLDSHLLAQVYLAMTGGQGSFFDAMQANEFQTGEATDSNARHIVKKHPLVVIQANETELQDHQHYLAFMEKRGKCLWLELSAEPELLS